MGVEPARGVPTTLGEVPEPRGVGVVLPVKGGVSDGGLVWPLSKGPELRGLVLPPL